MTRVLFLDTETSGLPPDKAPIEFSGNPVPIEVASVLCESDTPDSKRNVYQSYVDFRDVPIDAGAAKAHGITRATLEALGRPPIGVMNKLIGDLAAADVLVGHNILFDVKMLQIHAHRTGQLDKLQEQIARIDVRCTLKLSQPILRLPPTARQVAAGFGNTYKSPNLGEAFRFFFGRDFTGAHGALADCLAARDVYYAIRKYQSEQSGGMPLQGA